MDKQRNPMEYLMRDRLALFKVSLGRVQNENANLKKYTRGKYNIISLYNEVIIDKQMLYLP